jgi:hypothetical protein
MRRAPFRVGVRQKDHRPATMLPPVQLARGAVLCVDVVHGFTVKASGDLPDTRTPVNWYRFGFHPKSSTIGSGSCWGISSGLSGGNAATCTTCPW